MREYWRGLPGRNGRWPDMAMAQSRAGRIMPAQQARTMVQRIFIKVVGFTDDERHALNTVFRLSEQCQTMYQLWQLESPEPAQMALLDASSWEARVEAESPLNRRVKLIWVGEDPPGQVWRSFQRPIAWPEVVEAMDEVFQPSRALDFELGMDTEAIQPQIASHKRALIVSASRELRLYLRARLALAMLTQADEAATGGEAVELARTNQYDLALVDFGIADMNAWTLLRQLRQGKRPIPHLAMANAPRSLPEHVRKWLTGAEALLGRPPEPSQLHDWLRSV